MRTTISGVMSDPNDLPLTDDHRADHGIGFHRPPALGGLGERSRIHLVSSAFTRENPATESVQKGEVEEVGGLGTSFGRLVTGTGAGGGEVDLRLAVEGGFVVDRLA